MSDEETTGDNRSEEESKPSRWRGRLAWGLGIIALVYLVVASLMFWNADTCISTYVDQSTWRRFWAGLTCMTANEMGDMLAGIFAPLAFLGLIIAILLQGQDLELQRTDQALTRKVMEAQAKEAAASASALTAQAEEAKRTAEFMRVQTSVLENERRHEELEAAKEAFVTWLQTLMEHRRLADWDAGTIRQMSGSRFFEHLYRTATASNRRLLDPNHWSKEAIHEIADELDRLAELAAKIEDQRALVFNGYRYANLALLVRAAGDELNR